MYKYEIIFTVWVFDTRLEGVKWGQPEELLKCSWKPQFAKFNVLILVLPRKGQTCRKFGYITSCSMRQESLLGEGENFVSSSPFLLIFRNQLAIARLFFLCLSIWTGKKFWLIFGLRIAPFKPWGKVSFLPYYMGDFSPNFEHSPIWDQCYLCYAATFLKQGVAVERTTLISFAVMKGKKPS